MAAAEPKHIGILLFNDVEELDAIGPWEVLSHWTKNFPEDGYDVCCLSMAGGLVECAKGLVVQAHFSYATAPPLEVLIYPGGQGTRPQLRDPGQLDWVRRQRRPLTECQAVTSRVGQSVVVRHAERRVKTSGWCGTRRSSHIVYTLEPGIGMR